MAIGISRHGSQLVTADGVLGISGTAKFVYGIHIISAATGAVVNLRNGTLVTDTIYIAETGTASKGITFNYNEGFFFPAGCYVDVDANTTSVIVSYDECIV